MRRVYWTLISTILLMAVIGCKPSTTARLKYADDHPYLSERVRQSIIEGKVHVGMTTEQVLAAWGKPRRKNISGGQYGSREQWVYTSTYLYFEGGILTSYQQTQ